MTLAIISGSCLGSGVILAYWVSSDWMNLRVMRRFQAQDHPGFQNGQVVAFSGIVHSDAKPMISPFTSQLCSVYTYSIGKSVAKLGGSRSGGGGSSRTLAMGFHMNRTRIQGKFKSLKLCSLPSFEDDLRENEYGRKWANQANKQVAALFNKSHENVESQQRANLLHARQNIVEETHQDFCRAENPDSGEVFIIEEEVLPLDEVVSVVGTYDSLHYGLCGSKSRFGSNLIVYKGSLDDVIARVGKDTSGFAKVALGLIATSLACLGYACLLH